MVVVEAHSELFLRAMREAQSYKHARQRAEHCELGDEPITEWFHTKWATWYRERWIEHLCGRHFWKEFGNEDFDLVADKEFQPNMELVMRIIDNLKRHRDNISENLGMIMTAAKYSDDKEFKDLLSILKRFDINGRRRPKYDACRIKVLFNAIEEADRHKYIESQKRGFDMGEPVVIEWFVSHWPSFAERNGISDDDGND